MICSDCGAESTGKFCQDCGAKLEVSDQHDSEARHRISAIERNLNCPPQHETEHFAKTEWSSNSSENSVTSIYQRRQIQIASILEDMSQLEQLVELDERIRIRLTAYTELQLLEKCESRVTSLIAKKKEILDLMDQLFESQDHLPMASRDSRRKPLGIIAHDILEPYLKQDFPNERCLHTIECLKRDMESNDSIVPDVSGIVNFPSWNDVWDFDFIWREKFLEKHPGSVFSYGMPGIGMAVNVICPYIRELTMCGALIVPRRKYTILERELAELRQ